MHPSKRAKGRPKMATTKMATNFTLSLNIDADSRTFLQNEGYTLYLFKGLAAGSGGASTIWTTVGGTDLYDQDPISLAWSDEYTIGEESSALENGASFGGTNAYLSADDILPVALGKAYTYAGISWDANPATAPTTSAIWIVNQEARINHFYVAQQIGATAFSPVAVQSLPGAGGVDAFTPVEAVALILSNETYAAGTIITAAFASGAIVSFAGITSATVSWSANSGWSANTEPLALGASIYAALAGG
jgi:hypothetical protein